LARRKGVQYWCNSPGMMVRKLPVFITEILLKRGKKKKKMDDSRIGNC
jgi:hypothetical protein